MLGPTYEVLCQRKLHVHVFDEADLVKEFGAVRAKERVEDPLYPLALDKCEECLEANAEPRAGFLNYLRSRFLVPV